MSLIRKEESKLVPQNGIVNSLGIRENPAACIFVARNLQDAELTSSVYHHFERWGTLLGVKVLKDWQKRPYAFVQFESEEDCRVALQEAPGTVMDGRSIRCEPARILQMQLVKFGELEDITVVQPQGRFYYAFIKYKYRNDAITAYLTLKGNIGDIKDQHHSWFVEWASNIDISNTYRVGHMMYRNLDKRSLFVGNLHVSTCEEELKDAFEKYGALQDVHVIRKTYSQRIKKVFAFIKYNNEIEATAAIEHENGKVWKDKIIRVCYREYYYPSPYAYCSNGTSNNNLPYFYKQTEAKKRLPQQIGMGPYVFMPYNSAYDLYYTQSSIHASGTFYTTNVAGFKQQPCYTDPYASITYYNYYSP
ncbi:hypothetical protein HPULCUR_006449 [Helicostylum pulchrum]|uniref:RRM domain-containing protein n=1 Tax=Helicostylum pulchrum TaxID=562976 RepID=A0ABP9Y209_9FUNG